MLLPSSNTSLGKGAIQLVEIKAYIDMFEVVDKKLFIKCIRAMDKAYSEGVALTKPKTVL